MQIIKSLQFLKYDMIKERLLIEMKAIVRGLVNMLVMFIVCLSFILGVIFSEDINSFLKKCFEKIVRFRESTRDEEIKNNESIIKEKDDQKNMPSRLLNLSDGYKIWKK